MNLEKENSNCHILSGLNLKKGEHQEIKTKDKPFSTKL